MYSQTIILDIKARGQSKGKKLKEGKKEEEEAVNRLKTSYRFQKGLMYCSAVLDRFSKIHSILP